MAKNRRRKKKTINNEDILNRHKASFKLNKLNDDNELEEEDNDDDDDSPLFLPENFDLNIDQLNLNSQEAKEQIVEKLYGKRFLDNMKKNLQ